MASIVLAMARRRGDKQNNQRARHCYWLMTADERLIASHRQLATAYSVMRMPYSQMLNILRLKYMISAINNDAERINIYHARVGYSVPLLPLSVRYAMTLLRRMLMIRIARYQADIARYSRLIAGFIQRRRLRH